ncbi:MAG: flavin reductase family protein [Pseudomonadales bacterium]
MFYDPRLDPRPPPLTHNPLNALVAPRPIGWIGTMSAAGALNLAPFSYFNAFSADPPVVAFAPNAKPAGEDVKDTLANLREVPEFTVSVVSEDLAQAMNETSRPVPRGTSEFGLASLTPAPSRQVRPAHVGEARAVLECTVFQILALPSRPGGRVSHLVIGEVVGIHIDDALIRNGRVDTLALRQVARLGYLDYSVVESLFEMPRPG